MKNAAIGLFLASPLALASPMTLKLEGKYVEKSGGETTVQEWKNTLLVEPGNTYVANSTKKEHCKGKTCETETFRTEVTPTKLADDSLKLDITFTRALVDDTTRIDGELITRAGESAELEMETGGETPQRYRFRASARPMKP